MLFSALKPEGLAPMRSFLADAAQPILSGVSYPFQQASGFLRDVTGLAQLQADNARLAQENERLRAWYHTALLLESENKSLRDLLNVKIDPKYTHISARVISDAGSTFVKSLLVAAGQKDGVDKGQAVLSGEGVIGRIIEAGESSSRILLVTDINSRVPVVVENSQQNAIMTGTNGLRPQLIHLPQDSDIPEGARIVTSAYGGAYPQGLPVGMVVKGENGVREVALFANIPTAQIVRVIKMPEDPNLRPGPLSR